jgi:hypothetical protein
MIQPELTAEAGRSFALVGDTGNAVRYLEQGLSGLGDEYPRDRVLYMSYLAEAHLLDGELDDARHWAGAASELTPRLRSPRATEHLESVERRLPA